MRNAYMGQIGVISRPKTELQSGLSVSISAESAPEMVTSYSSTLEVKQGPSVKKRSDTVSSDLLAQHLTAAHSTRVEETSTS